MATMSQIQQQVTYAAQHGTLPLFIMIAAKYHLPPSLLMAVASRETAMGSDPYYLSHNFVGRDGKSVGIMQINRQYFPNETSNPGDNRTIIDKSAQVINQLINTFGNIQYAMDAYNAGPLNVQTAIKQGIDPDVITTGGNYGSDIIKRMNLFDQFFPGSKNAVTQRPVSIPVVSNSGISWKPIVGFALLAFTAGVIIHYT